MPAALIAIDQGTTSTRAIAFDAALRPVATAQRELRQIFPAPGLVEITSPLATDLLFAFFTLGVKKAAEWATRSRARRSDDRAGVVPDLLERAGSTVP